MRIEKDSMGEMAVPDQALYGASTQRAVLNFPISSLRFGRRFIEALGLIKFAAARANNSLGLLSGQKADLICRAANEVMQGRHDSQFVVDIFQTGSGTSTNMNANEVIVSLCRADSENTGAGMAVHPNDDVNMCQSSNDVIPAALRVAAAITVEKETLPGLRLLEQSLSGAAMKFAEVIKAGRTHLQDATPVTLGQEFSGYAAQIRKGIDRVREAASGILELPLGGTAVGTGVNAHKYFAHTAIAEINRQTGFNFREADNHFEAQAARDAELALSGACRGLAASLMKIADDIRWMSSGPQCGLSEISLPVIQPGSSIMPAKINPVICESVMMAAAQVTGNDTCVSVCAQRGNFELNVMMPVMAYNLLQSLEIIASAARNFAEKCINGLEADREKCRRYAEKSPAIVTALTPRIGYEAAARVVKRAVAENLSIFEAALKETELTEKELGEALEPSSMTKPHS